MEERNIREAIWANYDEIQKEIKCIGGNDDTYEIIEVKGDNKLEDKVVQAKAEAANLMATESQMKYKMLASTDIMHNKII